MGGHTLGSDPPHLDFVRQVLFLIWRQRVTTKCDIARECAHEIGIAAEKRWVTLLERPGTMIYGNVWRVTPQGCAQMFNNIKVENKANTHAITSIGHEEQQGEDCLD